MNSSALSESELHLAQATFINKVYSWMCGALMITAVTAAVVASSPALISAIVMNRIVFYGLLFGELGLVWFISARIESISGGTATALFLIYSVLNGLPFRSYFWRIQRVLSVLRFL